MPPPVAVAALPRTRRATSAKAWRLAWKLAQAGRPDTARFKEGDLVNITVVDDQGDRVRSYMTNAFEMYHPHEVKSGG